tara:strand:- start:431 stop:733 length:303 start_codon:yes stop_codon:yes gene_type:complete
VKKFYSIKLKQFKENIPPKLAEQMLIDESKLVKYLWKNEALEFRYPKHKQRLDLYADEKYLMLGKMKYPTMFGNKGRMGFMELYIVHKINQKMKIAKGST